VAYNRAKIKPEAKLITRFLNTGSIPFS
jgi:hypothetical protein